MAAAAKEEEEKEAEQKAEDDIAEPEEAIKQEEEAGQKKSCSQCQVSGSSLFNEHPPTSPLISRETWEMQLCLLSAGMSTVADAGSENW